MKTFLQIMAFNLIILFGYNFFSNSIPQMQAMPPVEEKISLEGLTPESFAALGKRIFQKKANCPLCHNNIGHRAPLLDIPSEDGPPIAVRAESRLSDPRYKGEAKTGLEYIKESMLFPSAFVVAGFGKTGTGDTVSPMPTINKAPMNLTEVEMDAVMAYLQQAAGVEITIALPTGEVDMGSDEEDVEDPAAVTTMAELTEKYECKTCHMIPGMGQEPDEADVGPPLAGLARYKDGGPDGVSLRDYIRQSILDPNAIIVKEFEADTMPPDLIDRLRVSELNLAIDYLVGVAEGKNK